jgi:hypothetical protein
MTAITLQDIGEFVLLDGKKGEDGYVLLSVKYDNGKRLQAEILDRKYCSIGWYDVKYVSSLQQNGTKDV